MLHWGRIIRVTTALVIVAAWELILAAQTASPPAKQRMQTARGSHAKKSADVKISPIGNIAAGPPDPPKRGPLRPEQLPAARPRVVYENGLLTVDAINSTMGDTLNAIGAKTNIVFEGLQGRSERIAFKMGPAPADAVISELFYGSRYDYLIVGRDDDPRIIRRVTLTPKKSDTTPAGAASPPVQPAAQPENDGDEAAQAARQQPPVLTPQLPPLAQPSPGQPRTDREMLQELLRRQQQLRSRPGAPAQPVPPPPHI